MKPKVKLTLAYTSVFTEQVHVVLLADNTKLAAFLPLINIGRCMCSCRYKLEINLHKKKLFIKLPNIASLTTNTMC